MPETKIGSAATSTSTLVDFSVDAVQTDAAGEQPETYWDNTLWSQYLGYYKTIPELNTAIDAKATWTVGKGFKADEETTMLLDTINGWGADTFNTILENCIRTYNIGGDSFCEIIRDEEGNLINLKPLDPGVIRIVVDRKGRIKRYEQTSKAGQIVRRKFDPLDILHFARNRVADEIHGVSIIEKLTTIILMRNEAMDDFKILLHRNVFPIHVWHLDTDDTTEIAKFVNTTEAANKGRENIYIPKGAVEHELLAVPTNATLNPLPWIDSLNEYFYEAVGVPKIIIGSSRAFTEASAKIAYLAFQQNIEEEQLFIEEQILEQLNLVIELEFPASLEKELLSDKAKDEEQGAAKPSEMTAGEGQ